MAFFNAELARLGFQAFPMARDRYASNGAPKISRSRQLL
jgi:hypothetical protein